MELFWVIVYYFLILGNAVKIKVGIIFQMTEQFRGWIVLMNILYFKLFYIINLYLGNAVAQGVRHCAVMLKAPGSSLTVADNYLLNCR